MGEALDTKLVKLTIIGNNLSALMGPFLEENQDIQLIKRLDFQQETNLYVIKFPESISQKIIGLFKDRQKIEDILGYTPTLFYEVKKGDFPKDLDPSGPVKKAG